MSFFSLVHQITRQQSLSMNPPGPMDVRLARQKRTLKRSNLVPQAMKPVEPLIYYQKRSENLGMSTVSRNKLVRRQFNETVLMLLHGVTFMRQAASAGRRRRKSVAPLVQAAGLGYKKHPLRY
jgi:hypothetical protein